MNKMSTEYWEERGRQAAIKVMENLTKKRANEFEQWKKDNSQHILEYKK